jgi:hypothetical protein
MQINNLTGDKQIKSNHIRIYIPIKPIRTQTHEPFTAARGHGEDWN